MFGDGLTFPLICAGAVSLAYFVSCWLFADELEARHRARFPRQEESRCCREQIKFEAAKTRMLLFALIGLPVKIGKFVLLCILLPPLLFMSACIDLFFYCKSILQALGNTGDRPDFW